MKTMLRTLRTLCLTVILLTACQSQPPAAPMAWPPLPTPVAPTATTVPPTSVPATATSAPPTATSVPPKPTPQINEVQVMRLEDLAGTWKATSMDKTFFTDYRVDGTAPKRWEDGTPMGMSKVSFKDGLLVIEDAPGGVCPEGFNGTYKVFLTKTADGKPLHLRFETVSDQCYQREVSLRMDGKDWVEP